MIFLSMKSCLGISSSFFRNGIKQQRLSAFIWVILSQNIKIVAFGNGICDFGSDIDYVLQIGRTEAAVINVSQAGA